jgi:hypothetical protein
VVDGGAACVRGGRFVRAGSGMGLTGSVIAMFTIERLHAAIRFSKFLGCVLVAIVLVWRMNTYNDPAAPAAMLPSVMCSVAALFLVLTGMAMGWSDGEDAVEPDAEIE